MFPPIPSRLSVYRLPAMDCSLGTATRRAPLFNCGELYYKLDSQSIQCFAVSRTYYTVPELRVYCIPQEDVGTIQGVHSSEIAPSLA